jgi:hypothetical protein
MNIHAWNRKLTKSNSANLNMDHTNVKIKTKIIKMCQAQVAHAYNPNYSRSRDQEDCGLEPALWN